MSAYGSGMSPRPPPGLLPPTPGSNYTYPQQQMPSPAMSGSMRSATGPPGRMGNTNSMQGTEIAHNGVVNINMVVDDLEIPFMAVRDSVRFLHSLFPKWSMPAHINGISLPNEVGSCYAMESFEEKTMDAYDGGEQVVRVRRKKTIVIKDIINQARFKVLSFEVQSKLESDVITEPFPPMSYIVVEIKAYPYEEGKFHFSITFDGGPHDVEAKYCCYCVSDVRSRTLQEEALAMRPHVYAQSSSVVNYIKNFNPETMIARQVASYQESPRSGPMYNRAAPQAPQTMMIDDGQYSHPGSSSKLSKETPTNYGSGYNFNSPTQGSAYSTGAGSKSNADELSKLYALYKEGALSKGEYEMEKRKLLDKGTEHLF